MGTIVVVGAGGIGTSTARELVAAGHRVCLVSRTATQTEAGDDWEPVQADAADVDRITQVCRGAHVIVNAVNPTYTQWRRDWPPIAAALLTAAEQAGAGLVTVGNLYGYGRVTSAMREDHPMTPNGVKGQVRADMWQQAMTAHRQGRVRVTELRASDYFGPGARPGVSYLNQYVIAPAVKGRTVRLIMGAPDATHSWTYLADIAVLAAKLATSETGWGRAWHVPTAAPRSIREVVADLARLGDTTPVRVTTWPEPVRSALRTIPTVRELDETAHQFETPFVLDSSDAQDAFGLVPTAWDEALRATIEAS